MYKIHEIIGRGTYGTVYRTTHHLSGVEYAMKVRSKTIENRDVSHKIAREIEMWKHVADIHGTVPLIDQIEDEHNSYMIMKKLKCSLYDCIQKNGKMKESKTRIVLRKVVTWMAHAHDRGICYGDMKAQNIMFGNTTNHEVYIVDFSNTRFTPGWESEKLKSITGTLPYMAPEVLMRCYDETSDVWSIGVMAYFMLHGRFPLHQEGEKLVSNEYAKRILCFDPKKDLTFDKEVSEEARDFILSLLQFHACDRKSMSDSMLHPYLK